VSDVECRVFESLSGAVSIHVKSMAHHVRELAPTWDGGTDEDRATQALMLRGLVMV